MLGFDSEEELLASDLTTLYVDPSQRQQNNQLQSETGEIHNAEITLKRRDGRQIIVLDNAQAMYNADGNLAYFEGTLTDITERKQVEEQVRRRASELEALYESGLALSQTLDPKEIGEKVIQVLTKRLDWHHAAVHLQRSESDVVDLLAFGSSHQHEEADQHKQKHQPNHVLKVGEGIAGWVIKNGQPVRCGDLSTDERYIEIHSGMRSGLYVPIKTAERTIGCIRVESNQTDAFTEDDQRLLTTLSAQTAVALHNTRLFRQINQRVEQLSALHSIDMAISASTDLRISLNIVLENTLRHLGVDAADILLLNPTTLTLEYLTGSGFHTNAITRSSMRVGEGLAGRVAFERQLLEVPDLSLSHEFTRPELISQEGFLTYFTLPLIAKGQVRGVLEIFQRNSLSPNEDWRSFLDVLAGQAAVAVDNALLFNNLERANTELTLAYDATIEGWSQALELRDRETQGHAKRVTDLTLRLARETGIDEAKLPHVHRGALLHDIGKMGIPDEILRKPGPLDEGEWEIMRQHPKHAYNMLQPIAFLRPALDIPYCHHEKWDGSGYPRGLKGEEIPLPARIFAVVDVFDALTSDRPYRKAWSRERALEYIREQSGKHFDPEVVKAFLTLT